MSEERTQGQKVVAIVLWLITVVVAVLMLLAGSTKVLPGAWPDMFAAWGYSMGFLYLIALLEVGGAIALLVPRFATYAAGVLAVVMAGAVFTLVTNPSDMGPTPAIANLVMLAIVGFMRRDVRWTPS